jgi:hypothetical protein
MWQQWIVGLVVFLAGSYALWYWMPAAWRRPLGRVQKKLGEAPGCSACSDCSGCATPAKTAAAAGAVKGREPVWMRPGS